MNIKSKVEERIKEHLYNTQNKVEDMGWIEGKFNYKCFFNAVDYAKRTPNTEVIMGIMLDHGKPILHFWCKTKNKSMEVSTGYQAEYNRYYELRSIPEDDWEGIHIVFEEGLDYWLEAHAKWWERIWLNFTNERVV